jgi:3-hydroxybutyryl-CoA dehydrogenase
VGDGPGLVGGRIVAQLVNEACFALGEGVASAADIDLGMELGLNHPRGPLAWGDAVGPGAVLDTLLALWEEYREERYRPAPALVRAVRAEADLAAELLP